MFAVHFSVLVDEHVEVRRNVELLVEVRKCQIHAIFETISSAL